MPDLPTQPGSVIRAKPPGRKRPFLMALNEDGKWQRLDGPFIATTPLRGIQVLFDAGDPGRELRDFLPEWDYPNYVIAAICLELKERVK